MIKAKPGLCSLIKLDDVEDVLGESPEKLADSVILFCQVRITLNIIILLTPVLDFPRVLGWCRQHREDHQGASASQTWRMGTRLQTGHGIFMMRI